MALWLFLKMPNNLLSHWLEWLELRSLGLLVQSSYLGPGMGFGIFWNPREAVGAGLISVRVNIHSS